MLDDPTLLDSFGWNALRRSLNQRVVVGGVKFVPSRVNRVWIAETDVRPVVVKRFLSGKCGNEFESLLLARRLGLSVPYPLGKEDDYLVMEYLPGDSCDLLINKMFNYEAPEGIGRWLAMFHERMSSEDTPRIRSDAVLSNFILSDGSLFGLDLEDSGPGDPLDDIGQLGASILGNEPFFTPIKFDLCLHMLGSYEATAGSEVTESSRRYISKHLRLDARQKPLFRRTIMAAAKALEKGWPKII